ncbi:vanadium-dependent haloperoxidase [uncultured Bradyrhizobium sp.]|uniref:vanadium-dependent haloperoxidase n=1 Tax=uncultured Bradyrhizobium sp. TaxID=199684 RepID=UPI0035CA837B
MSISRRNFFLTTSQIGLTAAIAGFGAARQAQGQIQVQGTPPADPAATPSGAEIRVQHAAKIRELAATQALPKVSAETSSQTSNKIVSYSKGLMRDGAAPDQNLPTDAAFEALSNALKVTYDLLKPAEGFLEFEKVADFIGGTEEKEKLKFTNPMAGLAFDLEGFDAPFTRIRTSPLFESAETAAEMAELYWMALLRDKPVSAFAPDTTDPDVLAALHDLNQFSWFTHAGGAGPIALERLFRADLRTDKNQTNAGFDGVQVGPYISQFLLRGTSETGVQTAIAGPQLGVVNFGSLRISQRQKTVVADIDYLFKPFQETKAPGEWYGVHNGSRSAIGTDAFDLPSAFPTDPRAVETVLRDHYRFIRTLRDGANYVHFDKIYQEYLIAACILLAGIPRPGNNFVSSNAAVLSRFSGALEPEPVISELGEFANTLLNVGNPYRYAKAQAGFDTFGITHIVTLLAEVCTRAQKAGWYHKWLWRRLRPEEFGARVDYTQRQTGANPYGIHPDLLSSAFGDVARPMNSRTVLARIKLLNQRRGSNSYLLPLAFPEGSPTHPAYPSGHAVVAGACGTILKALFNEAYIMTNGAMDDGTADPNSPPAFMPSADGFTIIPDRSLKLTVGGEIHKLVSNITTFRAIAGVHWRSDSIQGILLGEKIALQVLSEQTQKSSVSTLPVAVREAPFYKERIESQDAPRDRQNSPPFFRLSRFNGEAVDVIDGKIVKVNKNGSTDPMKWVHTTTEIASGTLLKEVIG